MLILIVDFFFEGVAGQSIGSNDALAALDANGDSTGAYWVTGTWLLKFNCAYCCALDDEIRARMHAVACCKRTCSFAIVHIYVLVVYFFERKNSR